MASGASLAEMDLLYVSENSKPALRVRYRVAGREYEARIFFEYTFAPRTNPSNVEFAYSSVSEDGIAFLKRIGNGDEQIGLSMIKTMFEHRYDVACSVGGAFNPSSLIFTSKEDANLNFVIKKKAF